MNNELRTFKLIDKEGFLRANTQNNRVVKCYMTGGCFTGKINRNGDLVSVYSIILVTNKEMQYFEEVTIAEPQTTTKTSSQPLQSAFSDDMIDCIIEDCEAIDSSLWFDKDSVVLLCNEDEYVIESVEDYHNIVDAIKLLQKFVKV